MSTRARESWPRSIVGAWRTLKADPIGILLPATGLLLVDVVVAIAARRTWTDTDLAAFALVVAALLVARAVVRAPLRASMLHAGASALGLPSHGPRRSLALLGVHLVVGTLVVTIAAVLVLPALGLAAAMASYGWFTLASVTVALGVFLATALALIVRAVFAYAPLEAVVAGRSGLGALGTGARTWALADRIAPVWIVLAGDLLVAVGGMVCGAGALPGYPISDLALLHRWQAASEEAR